jgi:hypothetical protein
MRTAEFLTSYFTFVISITPFLLYTWVRASKSAFVR